MWGTPTIMVVIAYLKMSKEDKKDVKKDFSSPHFIFTIGFLVIGFFLTSVGKLLMVDMLKVIGIPLMCIAGMVMTVDRWKENKTKSIFIPICIGVAIFAVAFW